ncbi:phosphosulfolactate synthase [Paenibacillus arenilitoris]|uniref:Phosphosulfolactate synthase n=1 Tax=Paenibacillus arenilitoris TaxID=2772299 RepID=A0A927CPZ0_9BACL|nr:phosphosulfolactate synthase [Paenibacillus arenilitoris]MBD2869545.1 phosphosulfolactate synthase [Paenibacillus arenilitoris]
MKIATSEEWQTALQDPSGKRASNRKSRTGLTMVIDKGMGPHAFSDFVQLGGPHVDIVKLAFGTSVLYSPELLRDKLKTAKEHGLIVMPGGTLLEAAVQQQSVGSFLDAICAFGFNGLEISDGTIELDRGRRTSLIKEGIKRGLYVVTEYGKKAAGSMVDPDELAFTADCDLEAGAALVTVEARESGMNVGLFDSEGNCQEEALQEALAKVGDASLLMWEAPLKQQQVYLLQQLGSNVHLGNISPADALALEAMRRGLRSDTFHFGHASEPYIYMI